jgi:glycosyltransferase involved in cell wall biosynthesis
MLRRRLRRFFADKPHAFVGDGHLFQFPKTKKIHVTLFGDAVFALRTVSTWPQALIYLWVLSRSQRFLLHHLFNIPLDRIGVVPRYQLFPMGKKKRMLDDEKVFHFVSASRASPEKNIPLLLETVAGIQNVKRNCSLAICGPNLDQDFKKLVLPEIKKLSWTKRPQNAGDLGTNWVQHPFENPVLIHLSTSMTEDFAVNVAQAQSQGWPVILSDWGAHKDVVGPNVFKIPYSWIKKRKIKLIQKAILKFVDSHVEVNRILKPLKAPKPMSTQELQRLVSAASQSKWSFIAHLYSGKESVPKVVHKFKNVFAEAKEL